MERKEYDENFRAFLEALNQVYGEIPDVDEYNYRDVIDRDSLFEIFKHFVFNKYGEYSEEHPLIEGKGKSITDSNKGGYCVLNDKFKNKHLKNLVKVTLTCLYPQQMVRFMENDYGKDIFNYTYFGQAFSDIYYLRRDLTDPYLRRFVNYYLTYWFTLINNGKFNLIKTNTNIVTETVHESRSIFERIYQNKVPKFNYPKNSSDERYYYPDVKKDVAHIDTYCIFFRMNNDIMKELDKYDIDEKEIVDSVLFLGKKNYIEYDKNDMVVNTKGIYSWY